MFGGGIGARGGLFDEYEWELYVTEDRSFKSDIQVITEAKSYHSSEIIALALGYQLVHGFGYNCPNIH